MAGAHLDTAPDTNPTRSAAFTPLHRPKARRPSISSTATRVLKRPEGRAPGAVSRCAPAAESSVQQRLALILNFRGSFKTCGHDVRSAARRRLVTSSPTVLKEPLSYRACLKTGLGPSSSPSIFQEIRGRGLRRERFTVLRVFKLTLSRNVEVGTLNSESLSLSSKQFSSCKLRITPPSWHHRPQRVPICSHVSTTQADIGWLSTGAWFVCPVVRDNPSKSDHRECCASRRIARQ